MSGLHPESGQIADVSVGLLRANSGHWRVLLDYLVRAQQKDSGMGESERLRGFGAVCQISLLRLILIVYFGLSWKPHDIVRRTDCLLQFILGDRSR
jgi:hypothetical protein